MKKQITLLTLGLLSLSALASCGNSGGEESSSSYIETINDVLYLSLYAESAYTPALNGDFVSQSSDEAIATYEKGNVITFGLEGTCLITFKGEGKSVELTVHVEKDSTLPLFSLAHQEISVFKGASYELPFTLSYGGKDVTSELKEVDVTLEEGSEVSSIAQKGNALLIEGKAVGEATFTISCEFLDFLLSKQLVVSVKEDESFFVYGSKMTYDDQGPKYSVPLYGYSSDPLILSKDLKARFKGKEVAYSELDVSLEENDFATLGVEGKLSFAKAGTGNLKVSYQGNAVNIRLYAIKSVLETYVLDLEDRDFSLEKEVSVNKGTSTRLYSDPSSAPSKTIAIPSSYGEYIAVSSLSVEGKVITIEDPSDLSFDASSNALQISSRLFDSSFYGLHSVSAILESEEYLAQFDFQLLFITKTINTFAELSSYVSMAFVKDSIEGYFVLGGDIDAAGASSPGSWTTSGWDYGTGFRATLDGRGHAIKNMKAGEYGLSGIIGSGALIQNLDFTNLNYVSSSSGVKYALFARGMKGATFRHINISLSADSITDVGTPGKAQSLGLFTVENAESCRFEFVKVDASGFDLLTLVGKQASNTVYSDCEVLCKSLRYVYADVSPEGVEGIKVTVA